MSRLAGKEPLEKQVYMRSRYGVTAPPYDELYLEEQVEKYAVALSRHRPEGVVLDAGCGTGLLIEYMLATGMLEGVAVYVGLDLTPEMLERAVPRLRSSGVLGELVEGDLEYLPFRDSAFTLAYSFTVVDLLSRPERGLEELCRVSRRGVVYSLLKRAQKLKRMQARARYVGETDKDVVLYAECGERKGFV